MKYIIKIMLLLLWLPSWAAQGTESRKETRTQKIEKELAFATASANNVLKVQNIDGFVRVEAYNGKTVRFEVERITRAGSTEQLNLADEELKLEFLVRNDSIIAYLDAPYISNDYNGRPPVNEGNFSHYYNFRGNSSNINGSRKRPYDFTYNFIIKVPQHTNLAVSTVNGPDVSVKGVHAKQIEAGNVNGAIALHDVEGVLTGRTVNGPVNVRYHKNPQHEDRFETVNGNITLQYKPGFSAVMDVKTMQGSFYTDLPQLDEVPGKIEKTSSKSGGTTYKVNRNRSYRAGDGKARLSFKNINGNITVKKGTDS
jgi:hypothetical protein